MILAGPLKEEGKEYFRQIKKKIEKLKLQNRIDLQSGFVDNFDEDGEPIDGESDDEFEDEEIPSDEDTELDEVMSKLESFIDTDAIVDEEDDIDESDVDITQFNDLGMAETVSDVDEDVELDLDELKGEINKHVDATLSKYFK